MTRTVTFAGISANTGVADSDGTEWWVSDVEGWGGATVRLPNQNRSFQDGVFVGDGYYGGRPLTVKGTAVCTTGDVGAAGVRLAAAVNLLRLNGTVVVAESPSKQLDVRLVGQPRMSANAVLIEFEIPFLAADPRKFATALSALAVPLPTAAGGLVFPVTAPISFGVSTSGGTATAVNAGTVDTDVTATFVGPCTSPAVERADTGDRVTVDVTLASTDTLVVDMRARTIVLNGTASRRSSLRAGSKWWVLPAGSTTVRFAAAAYDPSALLTLSWRSAWL